MKISEEIVKVALNNNICINTLHNRESEEIKKNIYKKYIKSKSDIFLWEQFNNPAIITDSDGWKIVCNFISDNRCLIFFDNAEDKSIILINNGEELKILLSEMFGFEFYVTNYETDYILCFNHHDCVLGCGKAKKWIESLKQSMKL